MKARFLIVLLASLSILANAHSVHMSIVNIDIDSGKIEYSVGLFYSDLQALINYRNNTLINFGERVSMTEKEQMAILDYINSSFSINDADSVRISSDFLKWKIEGDMIWLFFCTKKMPEKKELTIKNTIFLEVFNDQKNYVLIKCGVKEDAMEFNKRLTTNNYILN